MDTSGKRLDLNLYPKGYTDSIRRELTQFEPGFPLTREHAHVGLAPIVLTESCPSLGRNKKGGVVPPITQWPLF